MAATAISYLCSVIFFTIWPRTYWSSRGGWPSSPKDPPISTSPALGLHASITPPAFSHGSGMQTRTLGKHFTNQTVSTALPTVKQASLKWTEGPYSSRQNSHYPKRLLPLLPSFSMTGSQESDAYIYQAPVWNTGFLRSSALGADQASCHFCKPVSQRKDGLRGPCDLHSVIRAVFQYDNIVESSFT